MFRRTTLWVLAILALVAFALPYAGALQFTRPDGIEIAISALPPSRWGFGSDDSVQEASFRTTPDGREETPRDRTHRLGFLQMRERRWVPLK